MFIESTIKEHSMILTATNYHINIIRKKLNEIVQELEVGTPLFDLTTENADDACDSEDNSE